RSRMCFTRVLTVAGTANEQARRAMNGTAFLILMTATTVMVLLRTQSRSDGRDFWRSVVNDRGAVVAGIGLFAFDVAITLVDSDSLLGLLPSACLCALVAAVI